MKNVSMYRAAALPAILLALSLSGCSVLPKSPPLTTYQLPAYKATQAASVDDRRISALRVLTPDSSRVLDSDRIVIAQPDGRLAAWEGLRWSDSAPVLLRDRLVEAFSRDPRITDVGTDSETLAADLELRGTLRAFQLEPRDTEALVVVRLDVRLVHRTRLELVASQRFERVLASPGKNAGDVVATFGSAVDALAGQIVEWVVQAAPTDEHAANNGRASGTVRSAVNDRSAL